MNLKRKEQFEITWYGWKDNTKTDPKQQVMENKYVTYIILFEFNKYFKPFDAGYKDKWLQAILR
jgi:hypothetical protein